jgi:hypothetical protein
VQFTKENPVCSLTDCLACAVIDPLTPALGCSAMELMVQD